MSFFQKRNSESKLENYLMNQLENYDDFKALFTSKERKARVPPDKIFDELEKIPIPEVVQTELKNYVNRKDTKHVLSLGGGGAKGIVGNAVMLYLLEKIGVINKFEEIWGSSAGSITGSAYASGLSASEIIHLAAILRKGELMQISIKKTLNNTGLYGTDKILEYFRKILLAKTFEQCRVPLFCLATRIRGDKEEEIEVLKTGELSIAVLASMAIPDVFEPVFMNGKTYVDSGLLENTPCISVFTRHQENKETRGLDILSTCFTEDHFHPEYPGILQKLMNLMGVYRYQLQLEQLTRTRMQSKTTIAMINLDVPISKTDFNKMSPEIIPAYKQLLEKMQKLCLGSTFNVTI